MTLFGLLYDVKHCDSYSRYHSLDCSEFTVMFHTFIIFAIGFCWKEQNTIVTRIARFIFPGQTTPLLFHLVKGWIKQLSTAFLLNRCVDYIGKYYDQVSRGIFTVEVSRLHSYSTYSAGLLWTNDQPDAEISTWQHTTLTLDRHSCPRRNSNPHSHQASGRCHPPVLHPTQ